MPSIEQKILEAWEAPYHSVCLTGDTKIIQRPGWFQVVTPSQKTAAKNEVILTVAGPNEIDRLIEETTEAYDALGVPFQWSHGPFTEPKDLGDRLARFGFRGWGIRGMTCDPCELRLSHPKDVCVETVTSQNVADFARISGGSLDDCVWALGQPERRFELLLAFIGGKPVGAAGILRRPQSAYLLGGAVLPEFRGRGVYQTLVAERLARLGREGVRLVTTQPKEATAAPILERLGFETVFRFTIFDWRSEVR